MLFLASAHHYTATTRLDEGRAQCTIRASGCEDKLVVRGNAIKALEEQVGKLNSALAAQAERYTQLESTTTAELEAKQSELEAKLAAQAERYTQLESTTTAELEAKQSELEAKQ